MNLCLWNLWAYIEYFCSATLSAACGLESQLQQMTLRTYTYRYLWLSWHKLNCHVVFGCFSTNGDAELLLKEVFLLLRQRFPALCSSLVNVGLQGSTVQEYLCSAKGRGWAQSLSPRGGHRMGGGGWVSSLALAAVSHGAAGRTRRLARHVFYIHHNSSFTLWFFLNIWNNLHK